MSDKPLNEYIDLEAYDVVTGDSYRRLKQQYLDSLRAVVAAAPKDKSHVAREELRKAASA